MKYIGRITISILMIIIISLWHISYFWLDWNLAYRFLISEQFIKYDFIYTPLLLPFIWWLGKQYDKAKFYSEKDMLTEVYNRRFIITLFPKLLAQTYRKSDSLCLILIDCNNFKSINDSHGHKKGDLVLKKIASVLISETRKADTVVRWGGDEFLIVAPFTDQQGCSAITTRIENELIKLSEQIGTYVSVSIGTAVSPGDGTSLEDLLHVADTRMYKMKDTFYVK